MIYYLVYLRGMVTCVACVTAETHAKHYADNDKYDCVKVKPERQ